MTPKASRGPSLSARVLIGLTLGVAAGLFFGERATVVDVVGQAFVRLLQMSVIPYVVVSLVAGIGQLDARTGRELALRGGSAVLLLWSIAWAGVVLFPLAFPEYQTASFFSSALVSEPPPMDMLALYIPANPFDAMVHGIMPAIVLFSISVGVALITLPNREPLVEQLTILADSLMKLNAFVVSLAPYGVFALMASAAGTITLEELSRLQVFVITFAGMSTLLALWVLPGFVAAVTPIGYRDVIATSRDALVTAFATGSLLVVLPILATQARRLSLMDPDRDPDEVSPAEVMVPVAYNFPSTGKLLGLSFILFAGWFSGNDLEFNDLPALLSIGSFTFFGPNAMAIPYLLDLFRLPSDLFEIFLAIDVLTGRFTMMLAAMHTLCVALLTGFAIQKQLHFNWARLARWAAISIVGAVVLLVGTRFYFGRTIDAESKTYQMFIEMELRGEPAKVVDSPPPAASDLSHGVLKEIREGGVLQVCYPPDALPFAFINEYNHLVGYDVDVFHALAREMKVSISFHRSERDALFPMLDSGRCHVAIGGLAVTPERVEQVDFANPHMDGTLAFVVPDHERHGWSTWAEIAAMEKPRIAVPYVPHFLTLIRDRLPDAELLKISSARDYFRGELEADAMLFGAENGGAWTLVYPSFSVVVPKPHPIGIPVAYALRRGEWKWASYLDAWLELKRRDGFLDANFEHWILGKATKEKKPRWSVIRDVLGWVE